MKKDEIIEKLTELGIEFDPDAKKTDLEDLLPAEEETEEELDISESAEIEMTGNPSRRSEKAVDVMDAYGNYIRTYEESRHGAEYHKLAEQFVSQPESQARGYTIVEANPERKVRN